MSTATRLNGCSMVLWACVPISPFDIPHKHDSTHSRQSGNQARKISSESSSSFEMCTKVGAMGQSDELPTESCRHKISHVSSFVSTGVVQQTTTEYETISRLPGCGPVELETFVIVLLSSSSSSRDKVSRGNSEHSLLFTGQEGLHFCSE